MYVHYWTRLRFLSESSNAPRPYTLSAGMSCKMIRFGMQGGTGSFLLRTSVQLMLAFVKKTWFLISSASPLPEPSLFAGLRFSNYQGFKRTVTCTYSDENRFRLFGKELGELEWAHLDVLVKLFPATISNTSRMKTLLTCY